MVREDIREIFKGFREDIVETWVMVEIEVGEWLKCGS